jgi:hypothetical protein
MSAALPLVLRHPAFTGWTLIPAGVVSPSGKLWKHVPEAGAQGFVCEVAAHVAASMPELLTGTLVDALRTIAAHAPDDDEEAGASSILAWLTAETIDATWASCGLGGGAA